jgi:hypothetical protein
VSLLHVAGRGALHGTALAVIHQVAATHAGEVARAVEFLPTEKKMVLQKAIELSARQQQELEEQRASQRAGKGRLTLDASKFG